MNIINKVAFVALVFLAAAFGFVIGRYWERMKALPKKTLKIQAPQDNNEKKDQKIPSPLKQPGNIEKQVPKSPSLSSPVIEKKITQSPQPPSSLSDNSMLIQQQNSQNQQNQAALHLKRQVRDILNETDQSINNWLEFILSFNSLKNKEQEKKIQDWIAIANQLSKGSNEALRILEGAKTLIGLNRYSGDLSHLFPQYYLAYCKNRGDSLTDLELDNRACLTNDDIQSLCTLCPNLEKLSMEIIEANEETLKHISTLASLKELTLGSLRDGGLQHLQSLKLLEKFQAQYTMDFKPQEFENLSLLPSLNTLQLSFILQKQSDWNHFKVICSKLDSIKTLNLVLGDLDEVVCQHPSFFKELAKLKNLEHLNFLEMSFSVEINDLALEKLQTLTSLKSMTGVEFSPKLSDQGCQYLSQLKNLKAIEFKGCDVVSDKGLKFLESMPLEELNLINCKSIKADGVKNLIQEMPSLKTLKIEQCSQISQQDFESMQQPGLSITYQS